MHQTEWAEHLQVPVEWKNSIDMKFRLIPPGEFTMGNSEELIAQTLASATSTNDVLEQQVRSSGKQHQVVLTQPIYLGVHEVTQGEYEQIMRTNPSFYSATGEGKDQLDDVDPRLLPVEMVSWSDATAFCTALSKRAQLPEVSGYRLPTEAQWEFACRAGTTTIFWTGDTEESLKQGAWRGVGSTNRTSVVGKFKANPFALFDMHGNVGEWVHDRWSPDYYSSLTEKAVDPLGSAAGVQRVQRGGDWVCRALLCNSGYRFGVEPELGGLHFGFRVAIPVDAVKELVARETRAASSQP
jgi:formylglycine-generating enzyme required for sulfatase activity